MYLSQTGVTQSSSLPLFPTTIFKFRWLVVLRLAKHQRPLFLTYAPSTLDLAPLPHMTYLPPPMLPTARPYQQPASVSYLDSRHQLYACHFASSIIPLEHTLGPKERAVQTNSYDMTTQTFNCTNALHQVCRFFSFHSIIITTTILLAA